MKQPIPAHLDPCDHDTEADRPLRLPQARERILAGIRPVAGIETVGLRSALGRVLCRDVRSTIDVPAHTNSAMDGYALAGEHLPHDGETNYAVVGTAWAGRPFAGTVGAGECVRIMTGAPLPAGTDTVVMQEHVRVEGERVAMTAGHRPGQHVRPAGEDIRAGDVALAAGTLLHPAHLGLLASLGLPEIPVYRRPRVAFFSTGDELRSIGETLALGQIYDSNRYTLHGMLTRAGVEAFDMGVVRDRRDDTERAFQEAAACADAIVTSGGVSVGEADFVTETLAKLGSVDFWKVAMKPGKPIAFGRIGPAWFFGLPGNPVSVMATFYQLVRPALHALMGITRPDPPILVKATCQSKLRKKPGRLEFQRGVLEIDAGGAYRVSSVGHQGAGVLQSMTQANCFIVLPSELDTVMPGTEVEVQPFAGLV
ncbi:MAG TPA: gephyrin-like molybdotransferase Glp [Steroidobacteraceae bacterium]|nr:gephyrin-like molybdotransferase Glp [Steroidobacteraceae bacterium]